MRTQNINVKTAASESTETRVEKPVYPEISFLVAEGLKGQGPQDFDVYCFDSLAELLMFRRSYPERMKNAYSYAFSTGRGKGGSLIVPVSAQHFKAFLRKLQRSPHYAAGKPA